MEDNKQLALLGIGGGDVVPFAPDERGAGFENVTQADIGIPSLIKVEKNSRYLDTDHPDYIKVEGAQKGDIILSPSNTLFKGGVYVLPFGYARVWTEMKPRASGGGFVASHKTLPSEARTDKDRKTTMPNGNEVKETAVWGVLVRLESGEWTPAVVRMQGCSLSASRQWINFSRATGRPLYGDSYSLTTVPESNDMGSFLVWKATHLGGVTTKFPAAVLSNARELSRSFNEVFIGTPAPTEVVDNAY